MQGADDVKQVWLTYLSNKYGWLLDLKSTKKYGWLTIVLLYFVYITVLHNIFQEIS
jgi:hypothetical protein